MAKLLDIKYKIKMPRYRVYFYLENPTIAKKLYIMYFGSVKQIWRALELVYKNCILILDGPIADEHGVVIFEQQKKVEEVVEILKNVIERYTPGFKKRIGEIILTDSTINNLNFDIVEILETGLKGKTKERFMTERNNHVLAKIIKVVFESGPYETLEKFDKQVNLIFNKEIDYRN